jgi:hypothetical protein
LLQEEQPGAGGDTSAESGSEQPGLNATPGSQVEPGGLTEAEAGESGSAGDTEETAGAGASSSEAGDETAASDSATAASGTGQSGEGTTTDESGPEAGAGGSEGEAESAAGEESGSEASPGEASGEAGQAAEEADNEETGAAAAETTSETTADNLAATSQPPEIPPPVENATSPWLWFIVALAIFIIIAGAVLFLLSQPNDDVRRKPRSPEPATAEAAIDEGRELVAAGNYRGAIRHLFLAALLTLDERNLIHYDKSRTNYELLNEAELRAVIVEALTPIVETFERVWYGFETVGAAEYERLAGQIELLKQV